MTSLVLFFFFFSFSPRRAYIPHPIFSLLSFTQTQSHSLTSSPPGPLLPLSSFSFFFHQRDTRVIPKQQPSLVIVSNLSAPPANQSFPFLPAYHPTCFGLHPVAPFHGKGLDPEPLALLSPLPPVPRSLLALTSLSLPKSSVPPMLHNRRIMCVSEVYIRSD